MENIKDFIKNEIKRVGGKKVYCLAGMNGLEFDWIENNHISNISIVDDNDETLLLFWINRNGTCYGFDYVNYDYALSSSKPEKLSEFSLKEVENFLWELMKNPEAWHNFEIEL